MSVLNRKLGRQLRRGWLLLLAITSIITIGVMEFVALGSCYNNLTEAKRHYYRQCRMPDFWIDLKKVPLAELDRLAETPGVVEIRPRIQFFATVDLDDAVKPLNGLVLSLPDRRQNVLAERQRGVATLRVLGYGPWQIGSLMLRESLIISAVGTALGMPLGYMLTVLLAMGYDTELFRFPVVSTPGVWIGTMVLGIVFTGAAHLFVQRSIHRMDWLDALKAKE